MTLWPRKHRAHESAVVMAPSLFRSILPLSAGSDQGREPTADRVQGVVPQHVRCTDHIWKEQSFGVDGPSPFESTLPLLVDQAKSEATTLGFRVCCVEHGRQRPVGPAKNAPRDADRDPVRRAVVSDQRAVVVHVDRSVCRGAVVRRIEPGVAVERAVDDRRVSVEGVRVVGGVNHAVSVEVGQPADRWSEETPH